MTVACYHRSRHHPLMSSGSTQGTTPDLFSATAAREPSSPARSQPTSTPAPNHSAASAELATQRSSEGFANRDQAPGRPRARPIGGGIVRRADTTRQEAADPRRDILQAAGRRCYRFVDAWKAERGSSRLQGWRHAIEDRATVRDSSLGRTEGASIRADDKFHGRECSLTDGMRPDLDHVTRSGVGHRSDDLIAMGVNELLHPPHRYQNGRSTLSNRRVLRTDPRGFNVSGSPIPLL